MLKLSLAVLGLAIAVDLLYVEGAFLEEGAPRFDPMSLLKSALAAAASLLFVGALQRRAAPAAGTLNAADWSGWGTLHWSGGATLRWSAGAPPQRDPFSMPVLALVTYGVLLCSMVFVVAFLISPMFFSALGRESYPVETLSALMCLLASAVFLYLVFALRRHATLRGRGFVALAAALAGLFFVIGMEEVSWLQRVFHIRAGGVFDSNEQHELNLHNFATDFSENVYYLGAFVLLVLVPFLHERTGLFAAWPALSFFVPSRNVLLTGAVAVVYNYDMWNILLIQLSVFVTLFILGLYLLESLRRAQGWTVVLAVLLVMLFTQLVFLLAGGQFVRSWDVTEYKEFFIPLAFLVYALEMLGKVRLCPAANAGPAGGV